MQIPAHNFAHIDVWQEIRAEAQQASADEPVLASFYHASILNHTSFAAAISFHLANKLDSQALPAMMLREVFTEAMLADTSIEQAMRADIRAHRERDPACNKFCMPFLFFKGYHALQSWRIAHWLWQQGRTALALYFHSCAIAMSCRQLAMAGRYLMAGGLHPATGQSVVTAQRARRINALMLTCGHYDGSGEFAFRVGLPGKSGVGGGILAIGGGSRQHHEAGILPLAHRITVSLGALAVEVVQLALPRLVVGERLLQGHQLVINLDGDDGSLLVALAIDDKTDLLV